MIVVVNLCRLVTIGLRSDEISVTDQGHSQVHLRLLASGIQEELGEAKSAPAGFFCLTVAPFKPNKPAQEIPDLLRRIDALLAAGGDVLLFRQVELYHMAALVNRHTKAPVRFVAGLSLIIRASEDVYGNLEGRRLEALARRFAQNVRIYAYPMTAGSAGMAEESFHYWLGVE